MSVPTPSAVDAGSTTVRVTRPAVDAIAVGAGLAAAMLPWFSGTLGSGSITWHLWDLPLSFVAFVSVWAVGLAGLAVSHHSERRRRTGRVVAFVAGTVAAVWAALVAVVAENAAAALPLDLLPTSFRRLTVDVAAGSGVWSLIGAGALLAIAGTAPDELLLPRPSSARRRPRPWIAAAAALLALVLMLVARYRPWVVVDSSLGTEIVPGWALPWAGPGSLIVAIGSVGAATLSVRRLWLTVALGGTLTAWFGATCCAIVIGSVRASEGVNLLGWLRSVIPTSVRPVLGTANATLSLGSGPALYLAGALASVVAFVALTSEPLMPEPVDAGR